jgi:hypothetical protein
MASKGTFRGPVRAHKGPITGPDRTFKHYVKRSKEKMEVPVKEIERNCYF